MAKTMPTGERYYMVKKSVYESFAYRSLSFKALALFHHLLTQFNGGNNGNISATLSMMKHFGWASSATLSSAIKELLEHGFIRKTRQGGMGAMKQCSLYAFTHLPVAENARLGIKGGPATHDYREFVGTTKKKSLVRKVNGVGADIEAERPLTDSDFAGWASKSVQIQNTGETPSKLAVTGHAGTLRNKVPTVQNLNAFISNHPLAKEYDEQAA
ncbi:MAG: hypothetical protein WBX11_04055 [Thiobacillaceae bacterium]